MEKLEWSEETVTLVRILQLKDFPIHVKYPSYTECKNITLSRVSGNDQRRYILDLLKTYPPDINYLPIEGEILPPECTQLGFPKKHRHKLALLRPELIEAFVDHL